ncbi:1-methyladenosine methyltransferase catalytic subunit Gcd14 [Lactarius quietus]|nr:1-methyladenosine methyltransferase catalytic subunit Gcd14 [Lactarius quietus]
MWSTKPTVAQGDLVIVWLTRDSVQSLVVSPGCNFNSRYGHYRHSDLVGIPYGSKVASRTGKGFIHILRPTPELWTLALPHRTQILYLADIAFITSWLHIRPGSVVIEAGTGSGSFTHSIARTVGSTGHVYTYEFHEARAKAAADEFARHGMADIVTLTHRNVCKSGFTVTDTADAVFLDLPAPWDAIEHAKTALRKDRLTRICCFSPCIEQVLRTVSTLNDAGFTDITMYETLLRPLEVTQAPPLPRIDSVAEKLKRLERIREDKRLRQIAASRAHHAEKRKREDSLAPADLADPASELESKRPKTEAMIEDSGDVDMNVAEDPENEDENQDGDGPPVRTEVEAEVVRTPSMPASTSALAPVAATQVFSRHSKEVRGHTSFLTFACLLSAQTPAH